MAQLLTDCPLPNERVRMTPCIYLYLAGHQGVRVSIDKSKTSASDDV